MGVGVEFFNRVLKFRTVDAVLLAGDVRKDVEEIGRSDGGIGEDKSGGEDGIGREGGRDFLVRTPARDAAGTWVIPSIVRTVEEFLNDLVGSDDVDLVHVVEGGPGDNGEDG